MLQGGRIKGKTQNVKLQRANWQHRLFSDTIAGERKREREREREGWREGGREKEDEDEDKAVGVEGGRGEGRRGEKEEETEKKEARRQRSLPPHLYVNCQKKQKDQYFKVIL